MPTSPPSTTPSKSPTLAPVLPGVGYCSHDPSVACMQVSDCNGCQTAGRLLQNEKHDSERRLAKPRCGGDDTTCRKSCSECEGTPECTPTCYQCSAACGVTPQPTDSPTITFVSASPSKGPSASPSKAPSVSPSSNPTAVPTRSPSKEVSLSSIRCYQTLLICMSKDLTNMILMSLYIMTSADI